MYQRMDKVFTQRLLRWHQRDNKRNMPWKGIKDPYKIWLSEIILQQTRVEQGWAYYEKFVTTFPTVASLAAAPEAQVFKMWEGLGYYSRCRNLLATARVIVEQYDGAFPRQYSELLRLKGVGAYTAAAIASFAFDLPHAVVDGNVIRVLSRYFGIDEPTDSTLVRKRMNDLAQHLLHPSKAALYNQAIMDFGATECKPQLAGCDGCIFNDRCEAYRQDRVAEIPLKAKKLLLKKRYLRYVLFFNENGIWVRQRVTKDIWKDLYEFVLHEERSEKALQGDEMDLLQQWDIPKLIHLLPPQKIYQQKLSHQHVYASFTLVRIPKRKILLQDYQFISFNALRNMPFPGLINTYLQEEGWAHFST